MNIESEENPLSPEKIETSTVQDDATVINYIMLARIYDLLCVIGDSLGKGEDVMNLINLHRQGQLMSPPPIIQSQDTEVKDEEKA
jgi:hypothetical protein